MCFLVLSVAAAPEDPGGPGSGGADVGLQLGDQRAAQDTAQDPQEQPCEFPTTLNNPRHKTNHWSVSTHYSTVLSYRDVPMGKQ